MNFSKVKHPSASVGLLLPILGLKAKEYLFFSLCAPVGLHNKVKVDVFILSQFVYGNEGIILVDSVSQSLLYIHLSLCNISGMKQRLFILSQCSSSVNVVPQPT